MKISDKFKVKDLTLKEKKCINGGDRASYGLGFIVGVWAKGYMFYLEGGNPAGLGNYY